MLNFRKIGEDKEGPNSLQGEPWPPVAIWPPLAPSLQLVLLTIPPILKIPNFFLDFTIGVLVEKELYYTYQRFAEKLATECGNSEKAARMPVRFQEPVYGEVDPPAFAKYTAPGIILM